MNIFVLPDIDFLWCIKRVLSVAREERTQRAIASGEKIDFEICNLWFRQFSGGGGIIGLEYSSYRATDPTYTIHINVWQRKIWNGKCCKQTRLKIELNSVIWDGISSVQCCHLNVVFDPLAISSFSFLKELCITSHENHRKVHYKMKFEDYLAKI